MLFWGDKKFQRPLPSFMATKEQAVKIVNDLFDQGLNGRNIAEIELHDGRVDFYYDRARN